MHRKPLSPREREVASLIASGLQDSEIASKLGVARGTIRAHVATIYIKAGVRNRTELSVWWREHEEANA